MLRGQETIAEPRRIHDYTLQSGKKKEVYVF
jgi:hypothetical protein